ncbi:hypothetical protein BN1708_001297 [Verticillium longisporum]|uniref:Uncharacterized protein n=1 Tax=Verticillium longisporum TaxID=100787 RepID=A0A0G4MNK9_VERLO|nr:hypothetical protein BN1708_001297 [Verticillium longisporum]
MSGKDWSAKASIVLHLVTIHADFVTADDSLETVVLAELLGDVRAELHADTALAGTTTRLLLGIGPEHLHHETRLARLALLVPVESTDVIEGDLVVGEQTAVQNEILGADEGRQGQGREAFGEELEYPRFCELAVLHSKHTLSSRGLVADLDSGKEVKLSHNLLALVKLQLGILVIGVDPDTFPKVLESLLGPNDGGVGQASSEVRLDKLGVQGNGLVAVGDGITVGLGLDVSLRKERERQSREQERGDRATHLRSVGKKLMAVGQSCSAKALLPWFFNAVACSSGVAMSVVFRRVGYYAAKLGARFGESRGAEILLLREETQRCEETE